jgi:hypothetical protein
MNYPYLSPAAQLTFDELDSAIPKGREWQVHYVRFLKGLANRELPSLSEIGVKNRGLAAWEKSVEELCVAQELKQYAAHELVEFFGERSPTHLDFEQFLPLLITRPVAGHTRESEFEEFLRFRVEKDIEGSEKSQSSKESKVEQIVMKAAARLRILKSNGFSEEIQTELGCVFKEWRSLNRTENPLAATNTKKTASKAENMAKMLQLLPQSNRANETMDLATWKKRAKEILEIPERTFDRYRKELKGRLVEKPKGKFRMEKKARDNS